MIKIIIAVIILIIIIIGMFILYKKHFKGGMLTFNDDNTFTQELFIEFNGAEKHFNEKMNCSEDEQTYVFLTDNLYINYNEEISNYEDQLVNKMNVDKIEFTESEVSESEQPSDGQIFKYNITMYKNIDNELQEVTFKDNDLKNIILYHGTSKFENEIYATNPERIIFPILGINKKLLNEGYGGNGFYLGNYMVSVLEMYNDFYSIAYNVSYKTYDFTLPFKENTIEYRTFMEQITNNFAPENIIDMTDEVKNIYQTIYAICDNKVCQILDLLVENGVSDLTLFSMGMDRKVNKLSQFIQDISRIDKTKSIWNNIAILLGILKKYKIINSNYNFYMNCTFKDFVKETNLDYEHYFIIKNVLCIVINSLFNMFAGKKQGIIFAEVFRDYNRAKENDFNFDYSDLDIKTYNEVYESYDLLSTKRGINYSNMTNDSVILYKNEYIGIYNMAPICNFFNESVNSKNRVGYKFGIGNSCDENIWHMYEFVSEDYSNLIPSAIYFYEN